MLAAPEGAGRGEVDRGPPREPHVGRARPATSTRGVRMAFADDGEILGAGDRPRAGRRRLPHAVAGRHRPPRSGCCSRVPTGSRGRPGPRRRCSPTPRAAPPTAGRGPSSRWPARCCSTSPPAASASTPSSCAAATSSAATTCPTSNPTGMPYDHMSPREVFEAALETLDYDGFRREQAAARASGRHLGVGTCSYVEPTTTGMGYYGTEGATIRIEPSGKVNVYLAGGSTGNSLETTAVQLTADALGVDIEDVQHDPGRHRGHAVRPRHRREPQRLDDRRRHRRDRVDAARAHRRHRRPQARGRPRRHRARPTSRATRARHAGDRPVAGRDRHDRLLRPRARCRPACRPGLEASGRHQAQAPMIWANATHVCTCEVDVGDRCGHAAALHRERGLRPDDQPERRGGPDRRRHRAGDRRRPATSTSPTTTTATR